MNTSGWPLHRLSSGRLGLSPGKDGLANKSRSPDRTPTPVFPSLATSQTSRENPKKPSEAFFLSSDPKLSSPVKMARPPPAGAISARARPVILSGLWHSRQVLSPTSGLLVCRSCSSFLLLFPCRSCNRVHCSFGRRVLARWERNSRFRVEFVPVVFLPRKLRVASGCSCPARGARKRGEFARIAVSSFCIRPSCS